MMTFCNRSTVCGVSVEVRNVSFRSSLLPMLVLNTASLSGVLIEKNSCGRQPGQSSMYSKLLKIILRVFVMNYGWIFICKQGQIKQKIERNYNSLLMNGNVNATCFCFQVRKIKNFSLVSGSIQSK